MAEEIHNAAPVHEHTQADDINVGMVAVLGLFFAALLVVSVVGLQAWFYNHANAEAEAKTAPQGAPGSELAIAQDQWKEYLAAKGPKKDPTDPKGQKINTVVPIDVAMEEIVKQYGSAKSPPVTEATPNGAAH